jgi:PST family polysaccharide transporter
MRRGLGAVISMAGSVFLARLLAPRDFGIFAVMTFVFAFGESLCDGGLAGSLVRQAHPPTKAELDIVFTAQQLVMWIVSAALALVAASLPGRVPSAVIFLLACVAAALLLSGFQIIPVAQLERDLRFGRLGYIETAETICFYGVAVGLASAGFGVRSFGIALVVQAVVGTAACLASAPYLPRLSWSRTELRARYAFGLPFQGVELLSLAKDSFTPFFVGLLLGAREVGYITWANQAVAYALIALMALSRLYLPVFARLQDCPDRLGVAVERTILLANALTVPAAVFVLVFAGPLVDIVFGQKWEPALPLVYIMWSANLLVPTATPLMGLVTALGYPRFGFKMALVWMLGTWLIGGPLVGVIGVTGFAVANLVVQSSNFLLFRRAKQLVPLHLLRAAAPPWLVAAGLFPCLLLLRWTWPPHGASELALECGAWLVVYGAALVVTTRDRGREFVSLLRGRPEWSATP